MNQIEMNKPVKIILANCIFDKANPNEQSKEQFESLGISMTEFGYLGDLIVVNPADKKKKHFVHHGEHRIRKLIEAGNIWAWGFIKKMTLLQHKAFRQAMNKLHGSHDPAKDRLELAFFAKENKLEFLSQLIAQPKEQLIMEEKPVMTIDKDMLSHKENKYLEGNIKQIHLIFSNDQFKKIMPLVEKLRLEFKVKNNTDMFVKLVTHYFKNKKK